MPPLELKNEQLIPGINALAQLAAWLRPGLFAFIVGDHLDKIRPHAVRVMQQRADMLDEAAMRYPDVYPEEHPKAGQPHADKGKHVTVMMNGENVTLYKDAAAGTEFKRRERELYDGVTKIDVGHRITLDMIKNLEAERLPTPKGEEARPLAVDFSALMPFIQREPAPAAPRPVGRRRG